MMVDPDAPWAGRARRSMGKRSREHDVAVVLHRGIGCPLTMGRSPRVGRGARVSPFPQAPRASGRGLDLALRPALAASMLFSQVLDALARRDGGWTASAPADWMQGRSMFGGLQSAIALRAMREVVPADLPLRVLQTTFIAPVAGPVGVASRVLRAGKGTTHAEARLVDGDQITTLVVGVFGRGRPSKAEVAPKLAAEPPGAQEPLEFPFRPGLLRGVRSAFQDSLAVGRSAPVRDEGGAGVARRALERRPRADEREPRGRHGRRDPAAGLRDALEVRSRELRDLDAGNAGRLLRCPAARGLARAGRGPRGPQRVHQPVVDDLRPWRGPVALSHQSMVVFG